MTVSASKTQFFYCLFYIYFILYMSVLLVCALSSCLVLSVNQKKESDVLELELHGCEVPCVFWELNSGPLG